MTGLSFPAVASSAMKLILFRLLIATPPLIFFLLAMEVQRTRTSASVIGGARRSGRLPLFHLRCKLVVRHRNRVPALTRSPAPRYQLVFRQVLDELIEVAILILLRVLN